MRKFVTSGRIGNVGKVYEDDRPIKTIDCKHIPERGDLARILKKYRVTSVEDYEMGWDLGRDPTEENFCTFDIKEYIELIEYQENNIYSNFP